VIEISAEKASTVVFPLPLEMFEVMQQLVGGLKPKPPATEPPPSLG